MAKILVTGASGFVGSFLVEHALENGHEVYAGIRKTSSLKYLTHPKINFLYLDLSSTDKIVESLKGHHFDFIIHAAGITKASTLAQYNKVNKDSVKFFLEAFEVVGFKPKKFTLISSLAAYGPAEYHDGIVTENSTPHPVTKYGESKLEGETILKNQDKIPFSIIRPTAVYGPRELDLYTVYKMINSGLEMVVSIKDQKLTFIYVKDLVEAILMIATNAKTGNYFISDGNTYSPQEFNQEVKKQLNKRTISLNLPLSLVKFLAFFSEKISSLSRNYPALNLDKVNEIKAKSWKCDISNLLEDFNYQSKYNLSDGMKETIPWYLDQNLLK